MPSNEDYKAMHSDAVSSLEAIEQILANLRRVIRFSSNYMSEEKEVQSDLVDESEMERTEEDPGAQFLADGSFDRSDPFRPASAARKKLAVIKMRRLG